MKIAAARAAKHDDDEAPILEPEEPFRDVVCDICEILYQKLLFVSVGMGK